MAVRTTQIYVIAEVSPPTLGIIGPTLGPWAKRRAKTGFRVILLQMVAFQCNDFAQQLDKPLNDQRTSPLSGHAHVHVFGTCPILGQAMQISWDKPFLGAPVFVYLHRLHLSVLRKMMRISS